MQLNLAEKISIFLGATSLAFVVGLQACSPVAPSFEKTRLSSRNTHQNGNIESGTPRPAPNGLNALFYRSRDNANFVVGLEAYDWFLQSQPKNVTEILVSPESNQAEFAQFKKSGRTDQIMANPSFDYSAAQDGSFNGTVWFQLNLVGTAIAPAQIETIDYELIPPSSQSVREASVDHRAVYWRLEIRSNVSAETRRAFLDSLTAIRIVFPGKEGAESHPSPSPQQQ